MEEDYVDPNDEVVKWREKQLEQEHPELFKRQS